jgi:hypothetical protein
MWLCGTLILSAFQAAVCDVMEVGACVTGDSADVAAVGVSGESAGHGVAEASFYPKVT